MGGSETNANPYTSSFISLGLVYPLPQPRITLQDRMSPLRRLAALSGPVADKGLRNIIVYIILLY